MAKEVGPWTDLYSVGCMAYELFTGKPPFYDTEEPLAVLVRHISEALPPASEVADVDPDISAWIERLTAKEPEDRPGVGDRRVGGARGDPDRQARAALAARGAVAGASDGAPSTRPRPPARIGEYESSAWGGPTPVPGPARRRRPPGPRRRWKGSTSREPAGYGRRHARRRDSGRRASRPRPPPPTVDPPAAPPTAASRPLPRPSAGLPDTAAARRSRRTTRRPPRSRLPPRRRHRPRGAGARPAARQPRRGRNRPRPGCRRRPSRPRRGASTAASSADRPVPRQVVLLARAGALALLPRS